MDRKPRSFAAYSRVVVENNIDDVIARNEVQLEELRETDENLPCAILRIAIPSKPNPI
jgi:hypothetical protein